MPAITVADTLVLPRVRRPDRTTSIPRPVSRVLTAGTTIEGSGFTVRRPFPGLLSMADVDPFLLLDHAGPAIAPPGEAAGAPWHPHRGFETVTYVLDGEVAHHDSTGGGGIIREGDTQWMTAGSGIQHDERPSDDFFRRGGPSHAVQLWVNLPPALKMTPPRYQAIERDAVRLLTTHDGGTLIRLVAGDVDGHQGPGSTHTPITYTHVTLAPGARMEIPWNPAFNALVYALTGRGTAGDHDTPIRDGQLVVFGDGDHIVATADPVEDLDLIVIGGLPIRAPIAHYGPFVMNTEDEIRRALDDYRSGRLGQIPALGS